MNTDQRIAGLKPGQSLRLSGSAECWVTVERSGNGQMLRFVRNTPAGSSVFRAVKF